jgi:DNA-binding response OmpR family regulator
LATFIIIEDEFIIAEDIRKALTDMGHEVVATALTGKDGIIKTIRHKPDMVLIDILLDGDIDGIETAALIKKKCDASIIFCTAFADLATRSKAMCMNPVSYIVKPFSKEELEISINTFNKRK